MRCGAKRGVGGGVEDNAVRGGSRAAQSRVKSGVQSARCSSGGMLGGVQGGMWSEVQGEMQGEMWSEARSRRRSVIRCGAWWDGKRQKWRAKSLRTPFYQYSIYNQKDVLIIVLIILSHPLRSGHSHFHLEQ